MTLDVEKPMPEFAPILMCQGGVTATLPSGKIQHNINIVKSREITCNQNDNCLRRRHV